jgi:hypothetical protein
LMVCTRCKEVRPEATYYCCTEHQKADWKTHKQICGKTVDEIATMVFTLPRMPYEYTRVLRFSNNLRFCFNIAMKMVEALFAALEQGMFPDDVVEGIFGIQLLPCEPDSECKLPIGNLVMKAWEELYRWRFPGTAALEAALEGKEATTETTAAAAAMRHERKAEVALSILRGTLPAWFVGEVRGLAADVRRLARRGLVRNVAARGVGLHVCTLDARGLGAVRFSPNLFQLSYGGTFTDEELAAALAAGSEAVTQA